MILSISVILVLLAMGLAIYALVKNQPPSAYVAILLLTIVHLLGMYPK